MTEGDAVPLRDYVDTCVRALERQFAAHDEEVTARERIHQDAHSREHRMTEEAIDRASAAMDKRLDGMNEFRRQIEDIAARLLPRAEAEAAMSGLRREFETFSAAIRAEHEVAMASLRAEIRDAKQATADKQALTDKYVQRAFGIVLFIGFVLPVVLFLLP